MSDIQIFNHPEFGEIRVILTSDNEPLFYATDVAKSLGYTRPADAVTAHCKGVVVLPTPTNGGVQQVKFIKEGDMYRLVMKSKAPKAEAFQDWVCDEVLPEIRRHGGYIVVREDDSDAEIMSRALLIAQATLKRRDERIADLESDNATKQAVIVEQAEAISQMSPKVNYCDVILNSPSTVLVTQIAQDYGYSAKAFNKILHNLGIQRKVGRAWVLYAQHIANGYVQSVTEPMKNSVSGKTYTFTKWTQKGRLFLYEKLKSNGVLPLIEQN